MVKLVILLTALAAFAFTAPLKLKPNTGTVVVIPADQLSKPNAGTIQIQPAYQLGNTNLGSLLSLPYQPGGPTAEGSLQVKLCLSIFSTSKTYETFVRRFSVVLTSLDGSHEAGLNNR